MEKIRASWAWREHRARTWKAGAARVRGSPRLHLDEVVAVKKIYVHAGPLIPSERTVDHRTRLALCSCY